MLRLAIVYGVPGLFGLLLFLCSTARAQSFRDASDRLPDTPSGTILLIGAGAVDVNSDGRVDLYHHQRLYLQRPDGFFEHDDEAFGFAPEGQTVFGAIFGDYDDDGFLDVFVEDLNPPSHLFRNRGDGRFVQANQAAGLTVDALTQGSAWGDFNADGRLDLFVGSDDGLNRLFLGTGAGRFRDVTGAAGIAFERNSYGVAAADFDRDGDLDVFIASCNELPERSVKVLLRNDGDGTFTDVAEEVGVADNLASWGVVWVDIDNDGWQDLFVGNMPIPPSRAGYERLYWNDRNGRFLEISRTAGVRGDAAPVTFGVAAADFDNDGWQDLVVANQSGGMLHLYRNLRDYTFAEVPVGRLAEEARGTVVAADVDDDGWVDLYTPTGEREALWLNEGGTNHWLKVRTRGKTATHYGVGARIDLYAGGQHQVREITAGDGMTSQNHDLTAHFGLGTAAQVDSLVVRWPHGAVDRLAALAPDRTVTVVEGLGVNQPPRSFRLQEPSDDSVITPVEGRIAFAWERPVDPEGDALTYTVYISGPGFEHTVGGLAEPRLLLDAAVLPQGFPLRWTVAATDAHSVRRSTDRLRFSVGMATAAEEAVPEASLQLWPYPNPFRYTTTLGFSLAEPARVEARIYDATGRAVRTLVEEWLPGGEHLRVWDGLDDGGRSVAPGVYMVRLIAAGAAQSRVVVRVR